MTIAPIAFQSASGRYNFEGTAQLINAYAEKRDQDAKAALSVLPCDGLAQFVNTATSPCRGLIYLPDLDKAYSVHSHSVYRVTYDGTSATAAHIGTIPGTGPVQMSRNQREQPQIVVRSDYARLQIIEGDTISDITDEDLPTGHVSADYVSGYHVYGLSDRRFFLSGLNDAKSVDALDFATFQQRAGKLVRIIEDQGKLFGFADHWFEVWRDVGDPDFPFQPMGFKQRGLMAANSVVKSTGTLAFAGDDGIFYALSGFDPTRISTHHVERLIQKDTAQSQIQAFAWSRGGHSFINLSGLNWSRSYDSATQTWHSRESYGQDLWRAQYSMQAWGKTIVGDRLSGKLFYLDSDTYTEDGGTMMWGVDSPPLHVFPNGAIVDALHLDLATGYGTLTGQGSNPKIMLQVSTDGGNTFGNYRELELGVRGKYATRVTARRLGRFGPKGVVFRLRISDPVVRALVATDIEMRPLKR